MSEDLEAIMKALAGEPEPFDPPPRIRKQGWRERLIFNCWQRPFPYLLSRWTIDHEQDINLTHGSKRKMIKWVQEWHDEDRAIWQKANFTGPGPRYAAVPWLVHTNCDKIYRCPVCVSSGGFQAHMKRTGQYAIKRWRVYTCQTCGQRVSRRFCLREHPLDRCPMFSHLKRTPRHAWWTFDWFMITKTPRRVSRRYCTMQCWCRDTWDWHVKGMRW